MGQSSHSKSIIYALVLAIGMSFLFPEVAFSASRSSRRSGKFSASAVHSPHRFEGIRSGFGRVRGLHRFRDPFDRPGFHSRVGGGVGFIGGHVIDAGDVIIIQLPSSATLSSSAPTPSREPDQTGTYVYPHWVDGGHGVEILRPGYWSNAKQ
jgi:hypothetical protein